MNFNFQNNDSINKYNGQYLKCIVTKHQSSISLLANSGSLIIYQPNDQNDNNRCYIYLGNTFLASGYGFKNKDLVNSATSIINNYDNQIDELKAKDNSLEQIITANYNNLLDELKNYVQKDVKNGNASNTYIEFNSDTLQPKYVKLIDLINHGRDAHYDDIEFKRIKKTIITENNEFYSEDIFTGETQESIINVPIGTIIRKIQIDIEYDPRDTGGISKLIVGYTDQSDSSTPKNIYIEYDGTISSIDNSLYTKTFVLDLTNPRLVPYIIKDKDINIISSITAVIAKTPSSKYKNYPELESLYEISIKSTNQAIYEHESKNLASLMIHPLYYIKYYMNSENSVNPSLNQFNYHSDLLKEENFINEYIDIDSAAKRLVIAVPSIYKVINISFIPNSDINGYNGNEEYNWSGSTSIKNNINITYNSTFLICDIYNILIQEAINSDNQISAGKIKLTLIRTTKSADKIVKENETSESDYINQNEIRFVNELFDNIYWVYKDEEKLNEIYRNGLDIRI